MAERLDDELDGVDHRAVEVEEDGVEAGRISQPDTEALQVEVPAGEVREQVGVQQVVAQRRDGDRPRGDDVEVGVGPVAGRRVLARAGSARRCATAVAIRRGPRSRSSWPRRGGRADARDLGERPVRQIDVEDAVARQAARDDVADHRAEDRARPRPASQARAPSTEKATRGKPAQRGLEGGADRARVGDVGAHVAAGVDAGDDEVGHRAAQARAARRARSPTACRRRRARRSRRRSCAARSLRARRDGDARAPRRWCRGRERWW